MKLIITESQFKTVIKEYFDSERLYRKDIIVAKLKAGPKYIREYIKGLPSILCTDENGNEVICTKIPQVVYQFLFGSF
jgi:hypothetical protein